MSEKLQGLIAATYTPLHADGTVNVNVIPQIVERLLSQNIRGLYVCGSTGEGMSLSSDERRAVTRGYIEATAKRVPVIVQVGHNSVAEACDLAAHASQVGADIISATCPSYFKVTTEAALIDCMQQIAAAAPQLPFYYYHIPMLTGSQLDMVQFLQQGAERIASLAGLKYTSSTLHEFQECLELDDGRFDVVWGLDEMLLGALATGTRAAIGSTYNIAAPLYAKLWQAFDAGDLTTARRLQADSIAFIRTLNGYPFHPAMKAVLQMQGLPMGDCRLPQGKLSQDDVTVLQQQLSDIGFFDAV